ncbi:MAG: tetratricopeptide repeat protein, partial [Terriglobales bacterium]
MLGFGFNKAKILAGAERHVRQGKLQNAILDYEKIAKEDPKDLYVLNTIGDLYARLGNSEQAAEYFQRVGDVYASDGFTVRAIAMYKKLTKQKPDAFEIIQKLAQLYVQQGLHNDARMQYAQVAENFLQHGDNASATRVLQKILELDPENVPAQTKLADLYLRTGKRNEARDVLLRSAHALHARGALDASDVALGKVLELDAACSPALLLRGQARLDKGDPKGAIQCLDTMPDLDSRVDGLRVLLQAYLKLGMKAEAEPIAHKLLGVFHDTSAVLQYADWLAANGDHEDAIRAYQENATQL